ncbi:MAG: J domain-containing protein [Mobilitalea sp.]
MYNCPKCKRTIGEFWDYCEYCNQKLFNKCIKCSNYIYLSEKKCSLCGYIYNPKDYENNANTETNIKDSTQKVEIECKTCKAKIEFRIVDSFDVFYCKKCKAIYSIEINNNKEININLVKKGQYLTKDIIEAIKILNIEKDNIKEEIIKHAWKKQLDLYHPDKVNNLGEEIKKVAEERTKEINSAYNKIRIWIKENS